MQRIELFTESIRSPLQFRYNKVWLYVFNYTADTEYCLKINFQQLKHQPIFVAVKHNYRCCQNTSKFSMWIAFKRNTRRDECFLFCSYWKEVLHIFDEIWPLYNQKIIKIIILCSFFDNREKILLTTNSSLYSFII